MILSLTQKIQADLKKNLQFHTSDFRHLANLKK
jgi:hypothetical protein